MLVRKLFHSTSAQLVLFVGLMAGTVGADDSVPPARPFQVSIKREKVERERQPLRMFVTIGTSKFTFRSPDGFQVREDTARQQVILTSADQTCTMIFRVIKIAPETAGELDAKDYRNQLLARHPGAKITNEFSKQAAGRSGPAFDLQWSDHGVIQSARTAFIPSTAGILEFDAVGSAQVQNSFDIVLMNFQAGSVEEKMETPQASDQM